MKYLSLKSYFDLQKQRIFYIKPVLKKKQKKKFIYLFSKRQASLVFVKPLYLDFQNIIHFKKSGGFCKQNNLYLRGLTGLPLNNVYIRYKYFDYSNVFDRVKFKERYNFEFFGNLRKTSNQNQIIKLIPKVKKKLQNFFYFVNIVYTFKNDNKIIKKALKNKNITNYNKIVVALLRSNQLCKKYYLIFFITLYKKYLANLNLTCFKLQSKLLQLNKYFLYTIDLFLCKIQKKKKILLKSCFVLNSQLSFLKKNNKIKLFKTKTFSFKKFNYKNSFSSLLIVRRAVFSTVTKFCFKTKVALKYLYLYINNINIFMTKASFLLKYKLILN